MDIRTALLKEHSRAQTNKIVRYIGSSPALFAELVEVYLKGPYRVTQRAAWPLSCCVHQSPQLVRPHLGKLIRFMSKPGVHDAVKRNTLKFLQGMEIPKRYEGQIADLSFRFLTERSEPIAVRVFAMSVLAKISQSNPDLKNELRMIIEDELPMASPAFVSRARRTLKILNA